MKKKKLILTLSLCAMLGLGGSALASANTNVQTSPQSSKITGNISRNVYTQRGNGLRSATGKRGRDFLISVVKDKLKVTDEEINKALSEGKTIRNFANEKGLSDEDLKKALIDSKVKAIDEGVSKGNISKEDGETIKNRIKENSKNCTPGQGNGKGRMGKFQGNCGNCAAVK